jgi:hypothetical protein
LTLTFVGAAEAGAACSKSGEGLVINDELATSATSTTTTRFARLSGTSAVSTASTATTTTFLEFNLSWSLEAQEVSVAESTNGVSFSGG